MQISNALYFDRAASHIGKLSAQAQRLQDQISSGKRLTTPSDDAVAYRRLQTIGVQDADAKGWTHNIQVAQSVLGQADTALGAATSQLQQAQELIVAASNGTLSDGDRRVIAGQLRSIVDDLASNTNAKDSRGAPLFGSATGDTALTRDAAGVVSFTGTGNPVSIPIGDGQTVQPSESAARIFGGLPVAGGTTDAFALLSDFATRLEAGGPVIDDPAIGGIKAALDQVGSARASIGARGARLDLETTRIGDATTARATDRSTLEDTDVSAAIIDLQKTSTILQATQASLSRLGQLSLFDYLR